MKLSTKNYPYSKRVVIVNRIPRYDDNVKSHLSQFANRVLQDIWTQKGSTDKIVITGLNLGCENNLRRQRYGHPSMPRADGIHLRGPLGGQHLTESFVNMLVDTFPHLNKNIESATNSVGQTNISENC